MRRKWVRISGFLAWLSSPFVLIFFLIGFRNRCVVMYFTFERGLRLITVAETLPSSDYGLRSCLTA